jgi:glycosyltransferase involved in cell wall biosynthesis
MPLPRLARADYVRHRNGESTARITVKEGGAVSPEGPRVSIIIPTGDGDRFGYLAQLLEQLTAQTYQSFEIILAQGDVRQGRAINLAAEHARGDYLLTFDDDSRLGTPIVIERLVRAMDADSTIGMAGVENRVPEAASWFVRRLMAEVPRRSSPPVQHVTDSDMAEHPCLMMRKEAFYQVGGEHEIVPRGLDPYLRREFREAGYRVVVIPEVWIHHLPPPRLVPALKQFYRNGRMSSLVSRQFPDLALDNSLKHGDEEIKAQPRWFRALRHGCRMLGALVTFRWIYLATTVAYGMGALAGSTERIEPSPPPRPSTSGAG